MAIQLLVNVLAVGPVAPLASVVVPHGLKVAGAGVTPTQVLCDRASTLAVSAVGSVSFTVTNLSASVPASANFRAEFDHSLHATGATPVYWRGYQPPFAAPAQAVFIQLSDSTPSHNIDGGAAHIVTYDTVEASSGITLVDGSKITVPQDGIYEFSLSPQFTTTGGGSSVVSVWPKVNGVAVAGSASRVTMGNNNNDLFPYISFVFAMNAGDALEWAVHGTGANTFLTSYPASAIHPANPAIVASAKLLGS